MAKAYDLPTKPFKTAFEPRATFRRRTARAIARLGALLTAIDVNPTRPAAVCESGAPNTYVKHRLLKCTASLTVDARIHLFRTQEGPTTRQNITETNIQPCEILISIATTGLMRVRNIIITEDNGQEAGYHSGEDI